MVDESLIEKIPASEVAGGRTYNVLSLERARRDTGEKVSDNLLYSTVICVFIYNDMAYVRHVDTHGRITTFDIPQKDLGVAHHLNRPLN